MLKTSSVEIKRVDRNRRQIEFVASRQEIDREGDVVIARGIDTAAFMKNPVLLLQHNRGERFGRVDRLWIDQVDGADALLGTATILPEGISAEADQCYQELLHGALGGISIGFLPIETSAERILPGQTGRTYTKTALLEISVVTLPACASCTVTDKAFGHGWSTRSVAEAAARGIERALAESGRSVLTIEDSDEPVLRVSGSWTPSRSSQERFLVDPDDIVRASKQVIGEGFAAMAEHLQRSITEELSYHTGKIV